ncbi:MAG: ABC transporter permease [Chloroflexi bacterium]|nr:ABC transporter permease [Chloroflexota bacterium]
MRAAFERHETRIIGALGVLGFLLLWELGSGTPYAPAQYVSSPSRIASATRLLLERGTLQRDISTSLVEYALGVSLAVVAGIALGLLLGWYRPLDELFAPFTAFLYAVPKVAFIGLIVIYLGIGFTTKAALVFLNVLFPVLIATHAGVRNVDPTYVKCARSFGASDWQLFSGVVLPSAVPFILTGLRLGAGYGMVGVIVAEFYASTAGIGYLIKLASQRFLMDQVFVGVGFTALFGFAILSALGALERRFESWRSS